MNEEIENPGSGLDFSGQEGSVGLPRERAIIAAIKTGLSRDFDSFMDELERLVEALGLEVCGRLSQELPSPNPASYLGSGKLLELASYTELLDAEYVIFADTLSPSQLKNITREIKTVVFDRTGLILEIFKRRARTREARLQVEMASLQYMLPRLVGMRTSLGRQAGTSGSASNRGQGEKQIELDRRHIEKRISELRSALEVIDGNRSVQRKAREKSHLPLVALVGYTNAGKSSLMNRLLRRTGADAEKQVFQKDMLFATLDTSVRRLSDGDKRDFLLSDTVGFVSDLPHGLIKAFRSTLEEVKYADLLLLVADASDANCRNQVRITQDTLRGLGAHTIPSILVYNKADMIDLYPTGYDQHSERIYISAKTGIGIEDLVAAIKERIYGDNEVLELLIPYDRGSLLGLLNENAGIISQEYRADGVSLKADCPAWLSGKLRELIKD